MKSPAEGDLSERDNWELKEREIDVLETQLRVESINLSVVQGVRRALDIF